MGHRCLARGLSDIAAMGGKPTACFLSLGVPSRLPPKWVNEFLHGFLSLARQFRVPLAGGDTSSAGKILADILVLGEIPAGKAVLRSGARPGDLVYITGHLGGSAAVLQSLYAKEKTSNRRSRKYFYPIPRVKVGGWLREKQLATAMIDVSDGLSVDLAHLCRESHVSAVVEQSAIPIAKAATLNLALHGGEDYELLFTARHGAKVPPKVAGVPITLIGRVPARSSSRDLVQICLQSGRTEPLSPGGWQHFVNGQERFVKK